MATVEAVARENGAVIAALPAPAAWPCSRPMMPTRRSGATWPARAPHADFCRRRGTAADVTCAAPHWPGARLAGAGAHAGGRAGISPCSRRPPQRQEFAGRGGLRAGRRRAAGRHCRRAGGLRAGQGPLARAGSCSSAAAHITLVDDTYNANPDSVRAAIDVLAELPGPRLLVLGDMGEVGDQGPRFPCRGRRAMRASAASNSCSRWASSPAHAAQRISAAAAILTTIDGTAGRRAGRPCPALASVLVKGSRFMKMERVVRGHHCAARNTKQGRTPMLLSLAQWLQTLSPEFGFFRVFQYLTFRAVMAALTALLIGLVAGPVRDPPPDRAQDRPADPRLRHGDAPEQERHARPWAAC